MPSLREPAFATAVDAKQYILQVTRGLQCLVRAGLVHNDIRGPNVVRTMNDTYMIVDYDMMESVYDNDYGEAEDEHEEEEEETEEEEKRKKNDKHTTEMKKTKKNENEEHKRENNRDRTENIASYADKLVEGFAQGISILAKENHSPLIRRPHRYEVDVWGLGHIMACVRVDASEDQDWMCIQGERLKHKCSHVFTAAEAQSVLEEIINVFSS